MNYPESNLRDTHPIFAGTLERTVKKLFTSPEEFCTEVGIEPKQYDRMLKRGAEVWSPSIGVLTTMLFTIKIRSSMAFDALTHNLLEDIEDAWCGHGEELEDDDDETEGTFWAAKKAVDVPQPIIYQHCDEEVASSDQATCDDPPS